MIERLEQDSFTQVLGNCVSKVLKLNFSRRAKGFGPLGGQTKGLHSTHPFG